MSGPAITLTIGAVLALVALFGSLWAEIRTYARKDKP